MILEQVLPVSTVDKMVQADIPQGLIFILESYLNYMMVMNIGVESNILVFFQVGREIIIYVSYGSILTWKFYTCFHAQ